MKSGKYTLRELWADGDAEQFVVPELQRDYVWTTRQVEPLLKNLYESYTCFKNFSLPELVNAQLDQVQIREFERIYRESNCSCNLGFIYAYYDADVQNRYFLIDGQQRMTTIYLLMAYLAYQDIKNREKFIPRYFQSIDDNLKSEDFRNHKLKLDYCVREVAHEFLQHLIFDMLLKPDQNYLCNILFNDLNWDKSKIEKEKNITNTLRSIPWYHLYYRDDATVRSFIANLHQCHYAIRNKFKVADLSEWFSYLEDYVEFWYFDTNQSSQGEELYIYMNSRGEQLSYNENRRPDFLSSAANGEEKQNIGKTWDEIQNFFWKKRGDNPSADAGFNFFLRLVELLNIAEQETWETGGQKYATTVRVQAQLKNFINGNNLDSVSEELGKYYSEKWNDLLTYSQILCSFADDDNVCDIFPVDSYLQGKIPTGGQKPFLVFAALLIVFQGQTFDNNKFKRCHLFFDNLLRHNIVGTEPTAVSRALFAIARYIGIHNQDLYSLINYDEDNNLLSGEEKSKLRYLSELDGNTADDRLQYLDDILNDNTLLKGRIYLLLYATSEEGVPENPFYLLNNDVIRQKIISANTILSEAFEGNHLNDTIVDLFKIGGYFRYYSIQGTRYPFEFNFNEKDKWHDLLYYDPHGGDTPNKYIVSFIKARLANTTIETYAYSEPGLHWLQQLIISNQYRHNIIGCNKFVNVNDKIYFPGNAPLFSKVCSFADRRFFEKDSVKHTLTIDYDNTDFILKVDGTDAEKRIPIQKMDNGKLVWNFDELNAFVNHFQTEGNLDYSYGPVAEASLTGVGNEDF